MNPTTETPFPPGLPQHLADAAYVDGDPAWKQADCAEVIRWLSKSDQAVLGTEVWLVKDGLIRTEIDTVKGPVPYRTNCDPLKDEKWGDYVRRSGELAVNTVLGFRFPEDSMESPDIAVYFNITWADRRWFQARNKFKAE